MLARDHARLEALRGIKKEFLEAKPQREQEGELTDEAATKILAKMGKATQGECPRYIKAKIVKILLNRSWAEAQGHRRIFAKDN